MEEKSEKTICVEPANIVEKETTNQECEETSKIDVQAGSECVISPKSSTVLTSADKKEIKEVPEKTSIPIDNQGKNNIETALSGAGELLEPTSNQEVDSFDTEKAVSTPVGTGKDQEIDNNVSQSTVKDLDNLIESKHEGKSESIANASNETTECQRQLPDIVIDSKTEQELLSEDTNPISDETIEHQTSKLHTAVTEAVDDNALLETHDVGLESETVVEEKENNLHGESNKDSKNSEISIIDNTQVDKVPIPEFCSDTKIIAVNVSVDTVEPKTLDESNVSSDSISDNIELENVLSDEVINNPKDFHTKADISLNIKEKDAAMDVDTAISSEHLPKGPETFDKSMDLDTDKHPEENLQTEHETISDIHMSQDTSIELGSKEHGLKHPNMMIEIPTQELINIDSIDNTSDVSVNLEDKKCEDISSFIENDDETIKLTENVSQENRTETQSNNLPAKGMSEGTITFQAFEVKVGKCSDDRIDSELLIKVPKETETTQPEDTLSKDVESLDADQCSSVATLLEPSLSGKPPCSDVEPLQAPTASLPSTSQECFLSNETSVSKELPVSYEPSTSNQTHMSMAPDTSDEVPEVSDSLGLLAESSRVMEDDEEQETSEHDDVDDDDDDFDPDDGKFCLFFCSKVESS